MASFIRGMVKFVFILCYIAFMWASIHHVAVFFNNFEQGNGDMLGSYMVAGAFDITALVTTIGVMFFRKSMPSYVQWIVWLFILGIAAYSFFMNWEYANHYQNASLILQPTGNTIPVYDSHGVLHYVPEMKANTTLLIINPLLASSFTIFSLIYSIVAEFFGTKPPTIDELKEREKYLQDTASVLENIRNLEKKERGESLLEKARNAALEIKQVVKEVSSEPATKAVVEGTQDDKVVNNSAETVITSENTPEITKEAIEENTLEITEEVTPEITVNDNFEITPEITDFVNNEITEKEPDTGDLEDTSSLQNRKQERDTDKLKSVNKKRNQNVTSIAGGDAAKKIRRLVMRNHDITPAEIAQKVNVSRPYASKIRAQVLAELGKESA